MFISPFLPTSLSTCGPNGCVVDIATTTTEIVRTHWDCEDFFVEKEDSLTRNLSECVVTLILKDEDFGKLIAGKANAQKLFMSGKLKIKGDVMKATRMEPILKKAQTKAKL